jgi:hypothetical protein
MNMWLIAFYGWALYNIVIYFFEKQKADKLHEEFNYIRFGKEHLDNWIVTLAVVPLVVMYGPSIHNFTMSLTERFFGFSFGWYDFFYAGPGPFIELIYFLGTKAWPVVQKRVLNVIKRDNTPPPVQ